MSRPADLHDLTLPTRYPLRVMCANPFCESTVTIRGEHCKPCRDIQAREVARLRATKAKETK